MEDQERKTSKVPDAPRVRDNQMSSFYAPQHDTSWLDSQFDLATLFHALSSSLDSGLIVVNAENDVCFLNRRSEEIFNTPGQDAYGQGLITLMRDYQADALVREVLQDGEARETTIQLIANGRTLRLRCTPLAAEQGIEGALLLVRDITQLSFLERARRDLVANVSHELRTPLASLKLLVETLESTPPPHIAQRMMGQMEHEIDVVLQLAEELHELSQIESGRVIMQFSPGRIDHVITHALDRIRPQADRKHIHVEAHIDNHNLQVLLDEQRINQVLLNLLHNAVKFTSESGEITVQSQGVLVDEKTLRAEHIEPYILAPISHNRPDKSRPAARNLNGSLVRFPLSHPSGPWMLVSICDTGIGIPSQELPRIFERFYKVDRSRNRETGGSGLGLAIAKHLIEGHGGRLWADSEEGRGSCFYFTLPVA
jgi:two-component system phosphate regulon sensor histidine kinase PhoR